MKIRVTQGDAAGCNIVAGEVVALTCGEVATGEGGKRFASDLFWYGSGIC